MHSMPEMMPTLGRLFSLYAMSFFSFSHLPDPRFATRLILLRIHNDLPGRLLCARKFNCGRKYERNQGFCNASPLYNNKESWQTLTKMSAFVSSPPPPSTNRRSSNHPRLPNLVVQLTLSLALSSGVRVSALIFQNKTTFVSKCVTGTTKICRRKRILMKTRRPYSVLA